MRSNLARTLAAIVLFASLVGGAHAAPPAVPAPPSQLSPATSVVELSAGQGYTCVLYGDGGVDCWGANNLGQLGNGTTTPPGVTAGGPPTAVLGLDDAGHLATGSHHACVLRTDDTVACWGWNASGQLGDGTRVDRPSPTAVRGLPSVTQLVGGYDHTCALTIDGRVLCWGGNRHGQLGDGTNIPRRRPAPVIGITDAIDVAASGYNTCAWLEDDTIRCWGRNLSGETGDMTEFVRRVSVRGPSLPDGSLEVVLGGTRTCVILEQGGAACWGDNSQGVLGDGTTTPRRAPVPVTVVDDGEELALGGSFTCMRQATGEVDCWGAGTVGQLGQGVAESSLTAVRVVGVDDATQITAGSSHACALRASGEVVCWGSNGSAQLGNDTAPNSSTPVLALTRPLPPGNGGLVGLTPARLLDTRIAGQGPCIGPGATRQLTVTGVGGVPSADVGTVVLNVTVVAPTANSHLTVFPSGTAVPTTSNINFRTGQTVPNLVMARVGTGGRVSLRNAAGCSHVVVDVVGWHRGGTAEPGGLTGIDPSRLLDTRTAGSGPCLGSGGTRELVVTGRGGIPAGGVGAVVLNVTAVTPTLGGHLTVWPTGEARPTTSNLNFAPRTTVANLVVVKVGQGGRVSMHNASGCTHLVVDAVGWFASGAPEPGGLTALTPTRLIDTRSGFCLGHAWNQRMDLTVRGLAGIPMSGAGAVVLNVTAVNPTMGGHLTVWPTGQARPTASNVNFRAGQTVPNLVVARLGTQGRVSIEGVPGCVHVVVDVVGWYSRAG